MNSGDRKILEFINLENFEIIMFIIRIFDKIHILLYVNHACS